MRNHTGLFCVNPANARSKRNREGGIRYVTARHRALWKRGRADVTIAKKALKGKFTFLGAGPNEIWWS